jgi:phosphoglycolate phosphatase-like HAD superfamily hydrolase
MNKGVFLGIEEPAKLEALLRRGPEWEQLLMLASRHGRDRSDALALGARIADALLAQGAAAILAAVQHP